jgi:tRNA U34 5-methylaminomethyl-2-thiouridine-forming methyltransferase MnmC
MTNSALDQLTIQTTADGSHTFWSATFQEAFHSSFGAKQEAEAKFIHPTHLHRQAQQKQQISDPVRVLDICYGLGYNSAAAIAVCDEVGANLELIGLEWNPEVPRQVINHDLHRIWSEPVQACLTSLADAHHLESALNSMSTIRGKLLIGDARQAIAEVPLGWADAIFLDPFSPPHCPQLWTVEFLTALALRLSSEGYLATYSCAGAVRGGLQQAGLEIGSVAPVGRKSPSTVAAWQRDSRYHGALPNLSAAESGLLRTRAAIPYRDLTGNDTPEMIISRRQWEQSMSDLPSSSSCRKALGWN